jgi:hypothetical protein
MGALTGAKGEEAVRQFDFSDWWGWAFSTPCQTATAVGWEPISGLRHPYHRGGQPERHRKIPEPTEAWIVPSNRRLRFDGSAFSASAIRHRSPKHMGFLGLSTAFSLAVSFEESPTGSPSPKPERHRKIPEPTNAEDRSMRVWPVHCSAARGGAVAASRIK